MYSHHEEDSDGEEQFRTPKKRKSAQNSASKRARQGVISDMNDISLYEIVRHGKTAMTVVVDDWVEAYETDRNGALLDLIQFFINAAGCRGVVTAQMVQEATEGFQDIIKRMTEEFHEDSGDYPLIASGAQFKKFKSNFCDFVQALVRQCQYQIIYDQVMMDNVLTLLTELSNSQVRAFRHTSTLAAMKLMTGLVNVALQLNVSLDNTQRQYDAEQNKSISKRASEKLDILLQKRKELEEQQTEIEGMLNGIFKGIFVHRYRDYIAELRALCMEEIGVWMKLFPKVFLTDSYLKYVGWTLHDKQKEVRSKCLQTLAALYSNNEMTQDLKLFTSRFKNRIVSMSLDREFDVAVLAIKLLTLILSNCGYDTPVLSDTDSESIYQLVYSCHRPVAVAAAEFLNKQIFMNKDLNAGYTKRGRKRSPNTPMITNLVLFFIESELHEHATYLVDSLWDVASGMLKDWECMSDLLLEEPANDQDALNEKQESALVDIMVCSIKQAAEGIPPTGRQGYSKKIASRDRKMAIEDTIALTEHFIVALPNLLRKFQMDKEKVAGLLQIPRFFNLECYTSSRLEKHLDDLLEQMAIIVDKHTDTEVLEQVSHTYNHLSNDEYAIYSSVSVSKRNMISSKSENFQLALAIFKDAGSEVEAEEIYNVNLSLKKLTYLYKFNDLLFLNLYTQVSSIIDAYQENHNAIHQQMLAHAVNYIYYELVFAFAKVKELSDASNITEGNSEETKQAISSLRQQISEYIQHCQYLLTNCPYKFVQEESYMSVCDLLVIYAPQLVHSSPMLKTLVRRAPESLQHSLIDFVNENVFISIDDDSDENEDDNPKIDALHRRRSFLAASCKLIVFDMIDMTLAATIFQQYIRFYSDYGDIIKETISRSRHINKLVCARTLAISLMKLFVATVAEQGGVLDQSSQEYGHMKELARRFALTFGLDLVKTREAVGELHKNGILFSLKRDEGEYNESSAPVNLGFLGILVEFSAKLMKQDKKTMVQYLDKRIKPFMLSNQDPAWIPLVSYRSSLIQGVDDDIRVPFKGKRGRKKKTVEEEFEPPATPASPALSSSMSSQAPLGPPILQSTMIRSAEANNTISGSVSGTSPIHYQNTVAKDNRKKQPKKKTGDSVAKELFKIPKKTFIPKNVEKSYQVLTESNQRHLTELPTSKDRAKNRSSQASIDKENNAVNIHDQIGIEVNNSEKKKDSDDQSIEDLNEKTKTNKKAAEISDTGFGFQLDDPFKNIDTSYLSWINNSSSEGEDSESEKSDFESHLNKFETLRRVQNDKSIRKKIAGLREKNIMQSDTDDMCLDKLNASMHRLRSISVDEESSDDPGHFYFKRPKANFRTKKRKRSQHMPGSSQVGNQHDMSYLQSPQMQPQQHMYMQQNMGQQQQGDQYQGMLSPQMQPHSMPQQSPYYGT